MPSKRYRIEKPYAPHIELVRACASSAVDAESVRRINEIIHAGLDWDAFVRQGRSFRVDIVPLIHHNLSAPGVDAPPEIVAKFRGWHQRLAGVTLHHARALCDIAADFERRAIPFLPFKGPTLAALAYRDLLLRASCDLDILVRRSDFDRAQAALEALGFEAERPHPPRAMRYYFACGFGVRLKHRHQSVLVELHWRLMPYIASFPFDYERLWRRSGTVDVLGRRLPVFAREDLLVYVCVHANWPGHQWNKLRWVCDIAELVRRDHEIDWDAVLETARETHAMRVLLLGLYLARRLVPRTDLPPAVVERVEREPKLGRLADDVECWIFGDPRGLPANFGRVRFYTQTRKRLIDRIHDRLHLSGNDTQLIRALQLPLRLHFLYWVLGPAWKAGRHVITFLKKAGKKKAAPAP